MLLLKDLELHKLYLDQLSGQPVLVIKVTTGRDSIRRQKVEWTKVECVYFNKVTGNHETFHAEENQLTNIPWQKD